MQQAKQTLKHNPEHLSKKQTSDLTMTTPKDKIEQLFDSVQQSLVLLKKVKNYFFTNLVQTVEKNIMALRKYLQYMNKSNSDRELDRRKTELQYQKTRQALSKVVVDNSKLKEQVIQLYGKLHEKQTEIQKLKTLNRLNISYASSISFREDSEQHFMQANESSIDQKSFTSEKEDYCDASDVYCSDSQDNPKREVRKYSVQKTEQCQFKVTILPPPKISYDSASKEICSEKKVLQVREKPQVSKLPGKTFLLDINQDHESSAETEVIDLSKRKASDELLISLSDRNQSQSSEY